jgi:hypothetical protein
MFLYISERARYPDCMNAICSWNDGYGPTCRFGVARGFISRFPGFRGKYMEYVAPKGKDRIV